MDPVEFKGTLSGTKRVRGGNAIGVEFEKLGYGFWMDSDLIRHRAVQ